METSEDKLFRVLTRRPFLEIQQAATVAADESSDQCREQMAVDFGYENHQDFYSIYDYNQENSPELLEDCGNEDDIESWKICEDYRKKNIEIEEAVQAVRNKVYREYLTDNGWTYEEEQAERQIAAERAEVEFQELLKSILPLAPTV